MKKIYTLVLLLSTVIFSSAQVASDIDGVYSLSSGRLLRLQYSTGTSSWESQGTYTNTYCGNSFYFDPAYPIIKDMNYVSTNKWTAKERYYCASTCIYHYLDIEMSLENFGQNLKRVVTTTSLPCNATSAPVDYWDRYLQTGIVNNSIENVDVIRIFPNPNNGEFTIESQKELSMSVKNILGQVIEEEQLHTGKNSINLNGHSKGIYFIKISDGSGSYSQKLIID